MGYEESLYELVAIISELIDFEESAVMSRLIVKPGVSEELDQLKHVYNGLDDFLVSE